MWVVEKPSCCLVSEKIENVATQFEQVTHCQGNTLVDRLTLARNGSERTKLY